MEDALRNLKPLCINLTFAQLDCETFLLLIFKLCHLPVQKARQSRGQLNLQNFQETLKKLRCYDTEDPLSIEELLDQRT